MASVIRGRTWKIKSIVWLDKDAGLKANLTGATIMTMFKVSPRDTDAQAVLTKSTADSVTITDAANGLCQTLVSPSEANTIGSSINTLFFEVIAKLADGTEISSGIDQVTIEGNIKRVPL